MKEYRLKYDLHTRTTFSHGKGSIEDNVKVALSKGMSKIGISDHGPGHLTYGVKRRNFAVMREEIQRLQTLYPDIEILLGIEANIIDPSGQLDISKQEMDAFDYVLAGYHFGAFGKNPIHALKVHGKNFVMTGLMKKSTQSQKLINTELVVRAIYENRILLLTHPGDKGPFDIEEIAQACAKRGTLMEISSGHDYLTVEGIKIAAKSDVQFMINSDAHTPDKIGDCQNAVKRIIKAGLDLDRVVNLEVL